MGRADLSEPRALAYWLAVISRHHYFISREDFFHIIFFQFYQVKIDICSLNPFDG